MVFPACCMLWYINATWSYAATNFMVGGSWFASVSGENGQLKQLFDILRPGTAIPSRKKQGSERRVPARRCLRNMARFKECHSRRVSSWGFNPWAAISFWILLCCQSVRPTIQRRSPLSRWSTGRCCVHPTKQGRSWSRADKIPRKSPSLFGISFWKRLYINISRFVVEGRNSTRLRFSTGWHSWEFGFGITKQCVARTPLLNNGVL